MKTTQEVLKHLMFFKMYISGSQVKVINHIKAQYKEKKKKTKANGCR